jgi:hypothetical protein
MKNIYSPQARGAATECAIDRALCTAYIADQGFVPPVLVIQGLVIQGLVIWLGDRDLMI